MNKLLVTFLLLIFALGSLQGPPELCADDMDSHAPSEAAEADVAVGDSHADDEDCGCLPWQCHSECQRCPYTPGMPGTVMVSPLPQAVSQTLVACSPSSLTWIEKSDPLLDPPRYL